MEQAINQFTKGLQMDTNPMMLNNTTLTDALNATIITMSGNEVVLQNDMGNRRVEDAFLPSGYLPVGMKEYGGIIYVAAYNPITNKSQIGSFPSPERKIKLYSGDNSPHTKNINLDNLFQCSNSENGIQFLSSDTVLLPLTQLKNPDEELYIHPGDRFTVYCNKFDDYNNISNFDNIYDGKVKTPKNKKYTLSLGILNSQNEFVDITPLLKRWLKNNNEWKIVEESEELKNELKDKSDLYKFNYGYFIPELSETYDFGTTDDDRKFRENRTADPANTYSYKLIGPLYLKVLLNHITKFNYNIYADKESDNTAIITIEADITYNCPDGIKGTSPPEDFNDIDYYTFDEGTLIEQGISNSSFGFDFKIISNGTVSSSSLIFEPGKNEVKYNKQTNEYTVTLLKQYTISGINEDNEIKYFIGVKSGSELCESQICNSCYIEELSQFGTLNPKLFNTGSVEVKEWRFFNNVERQTTELTYLLEAYPKRGLNLGSLKIELYPYKIDSSDKVQTSENIAYSIILQENITGGRHTILLDWNLDENNILKNKKLYDVKLYRSYNNLTLLEYLDLKGYKYIGEKSKYIIIEENDKYYYYSKAESYSQKIEISSKIFFLDNESPGLHKTYIIFHLNEEDKIIQESITFIPEEDKEILYEISSDLWLLTTPLLNECYYFNSSKYAPHYCLKENDDSLTYKYPSILDLMTIDPFKFLEITETGKFETTLEGSLYYVKDENNEYSYVDIYSGEKTQLRLNENPFFKYKYNYEGEIKLKVVDLDLYPDCVIIHPSIDYHVFDLEKTNPNDPIDILNLSEKRGYTYTYNDEISLNLNLLVNNITINKLFLRFGYILDKIDDINKIRRHNNFLVGVCSKGTSGHRDPHYLVIRNYLSISEQGSEEWEQLDAVKSDGGICFSFDKYKNQIIEFIEEDRQNYIFAYGFGKVKYSDNETMIFSNTIYDQSAGGMKTPRYSRLWWKTNKENLYAIFNELIDRNNNTNDDNKEYNFDLKNTLKNYFGNLIYNVADNVTSQSQEFDGINNIYTINNEKIIYNDKHNDQFMLKIKLLSSELTPIYPKKVFIFEDNHESLYKTIVFGSSLEFFDILESFDPYFIKCLYVDFDSNNKINYVLGADKNSKILTPSLSYYRKMNDGIKLYPTSDFISNPLYTLDYNSNYYAPLYSGTNTKLKCRYDNIIQSHSDLNTSLNYDNVYVVPSNIEELKNSYTGDTTVVIDTRPGSDSGWTGGGSGGGSGKDINDRDRPVDPRDRNRNQEEELINLNI